MEINKVASHKTLTKLFDTILTGNKDDSRKAARAVRKSLYGSHERGIFDEIRKIIETAPRKYIDIVEDWRQENFVIAVSIFYFLHDRESQPDFLFPWLFHLFLHKNGNVRYSAVRMMEHELGPLTVHIRCPEYRINKAKSEQSDFILAKLFVSLNSLLTDVWKPEYKRYKYIDSLPTCPYKSIQMVLVIMEESCGKAYMKRLETQLM